MSEEYLGILTAAMSIISAALVAIFGLIIFYAQKAIEHDHKYAEELEKRYEKYLHSIFDVVANDSLENQAEFSKNKVSLRLFAPAEVLELAKMFEDHVSRINTVSDPNLLAANLVFAMRKHVTPKRKIGVSAVDMQRLNSFKVT